MIPHILHQTWKTARVPEAFAQFQARWRALHPEFEYRLWTDADNDRFVREHYPGWYALYRSFDREIFRADMARYLYLHHFGGVYVDLDIEPLRPLHALLAQHTCLLGSEPPVHAQRLWNKKQLACNAIMASEPGHPFWLRMLHEIAERARSHDTSNPVSTTGPITLDAVYEREGAALGVTLAPPDAFFPVPDLDNTKLQLSAALTQHYRNMIELAAFPTTSWGVHHWAHTWIKTQGSKRFYLRSRARARELAMVLRSQRTIDEVTRRSRYGLQFPEHAFPARSSQREHYALTVQRGYEAARKLRVSVLALLHNRVDLALPLRARLTRLFAPFARGQVFIISDDSSDGTAQVIADWQQAEPERVVRVPPPELTSCRTVYARMSRLRNALLRAHEAHAPDSDLTIMLDGDLAGPISLDGLMHAVALLQSGEADAAAAFGINNWGGLPGMVPFLGYSYYDPIAFREHSFQRTLSDAQVRLRLAGLRRGDAALPVKSAFAGLVLYKTKVLTGLTYDESTDDCEHVSLHRALRARGARLVIDPALLLLSGRQGHHQAPRLSGARQDAPSRVLGHSQDRLDRVHAHTAREHTRVAHE